MAILRRLGTLVLAAGLLVTLACSDDGGDADSDGLQPTTYHVSALDYAFIGLPSIPIAVGSKFELKNDSTKELHELVAIRINDNEKRAVKDLIQLPDQELVGKVSEEPAMVLIAPPTQSAIAVLGDGKITEPGRYALLCFIPTGADPAAYLAAAQTGDGPPQVAGGPPHAFQGMLGEVTVR